MEQTARYPRVLVVAANPFSRRSNNGLTMTSLFEGWPKDRLAQVFVPFVTPAPPEFDVCSRYWALTPRGLKRVEETVPVEALPGRPSKLRNFAVRLATESRLAPRIAQPLREMVYSRPGLLDGPEMAEIEAFEPDLIFSTLGSLGQLRQVERLSERLGVPVVPFFTDDWITTEYRRAFGSGILRRKLAESFRRIVDASPLRLAISPAMAEEYTKRYGGEFHAFCRCVDAGAFLATPRVGGGEWIEMVYAGQLGFDRWKYLKKIGEALRELLDEGIRARLTVYTVPAHVDLYGAELTMDPVMRVAGYVESDRLPAVYDAADVLVHCESFDTSLADYTRFSLSTKVSEYMMAARPLLGYGPADVGSMRYIAESGAGAVISEDSPAHVKARLRELMGDRARLNEWGRRAREHALEHHEGTRQRERFRDLLARAVQPRADRARAAS
ncbi:MAG TPA: hypothetical protein VFE05_08050 [Longimicrobiaceae bacterium]|jgi:glycosyltransferase involved in cell wall biosynthesis|nr:hypothetical protein [Longimicrobiaceae bacterium]